MVSDVPKVFIVDDEDSVRRALQSLMEASGFSVVTCRSAAEFLDKYDSSQSGCLILDVRMPEMNGIELHSYLVRNRVFIPVIILTGHGDVPMAVSAMDEGAFYFMQKPADVDLLVAKVAEAVEVDCQRRREFAERTEIEQLYSTLTAREQEVLNLLVQGKQTSSVATALGTRESTIRVQRAAILKKMRADSVIDLMRMMSLLNEQQKLQT